MVIKKIFFLHKEPFYFLVPKRWVQCICLQAISPVSFTIESCLYRGTHYLYLTPNPSFFLLCSQAFYIMVKLRPLSQIKKNIFEYVFTEIEKNCQLWRLVVSIFNAAKKNTNHSKKLLYDYCTCASSFKRIKELNLCKNHKRQGKQINESLTRHSH